MDLGFLHQGWTTIRPATACPFSSIAADTLEQADVRIGAGHLDQPGVPGTARTSSFLPAAASKGPRWYHQDEDHFNSERRDTGFSALPATHPP